MTMPTLVTQHAEDESTQIQWDPNNLHILLSASASSLSTVKPLMHIARSPKYDLTDTTWYIACTGFNFSNVPNIISGVTANININRGGRIADDTIQLVYQGEVIGVNQAQPAFIHTSSQDKSLMELKAVYGGENNNWGVDGLTKEMVQDSTFGIVLRYKSHPAWPHKTSPILYSVQLQIH